MVIINRKGKINSLELDSAQHLKYISLVIHFQQHWKNRNEKEGIKNVYDNPVDSALGPDACFYLLQQYNASIDGNK